MGLFSGYRADRLIAEVRESGDPDSPRAKQALARLQGMASAHALGRIGTTEEIAEAIEFVARAEWITGDVLSVDGGLGLGHTHT